MSIHTICFYGEIRKIQCFMWIPLLTWSYGLPEKGRKGTDELENET